MPSDSDPAVLPGDVCQARRLPADKISCPSQAVINIIKPPVRDPRGFLQQHIRQDLEQLTRTLGRSADEAINAVHLVLRSLLGRQRHPSGQSELEGRGGGWSLLTTPGTDKGSWEGCGDERREGWLLSLRFPPPPGQHVSTEASHVCARAGRPCVIQGGQGV